MTGCSARGQGQERSIRTPSTLEKDLKQTLRFVYRTFIEILLRERTVNDILSSLDIIAAAFTLMYLARLLISLNGEDCASANPFEKRSLMNQNIRRRLA